MAYLSNYYVMILVSGSWTLLKTSGNELRSFNTAQAAVDAVKGTYGNDEYKVVQEYSVTKTDTATS